LLVSVLVICVGCCQTRDDVMVNPSETDKAFMTAAAYKNMYAIDAGLLSVEHAEDSAIKEFGRKMAEDNVKAGTELKDIAAYFNYSLPLSPDSLHAAQKLLLMNAGGKDFDSLFILYQIKDLEETIDLYEGRLNAHVSSLLETYAGKYLPMIREHLQDAETLKRQVNIIE